MSHSAVKLIPLGGLDGIGKNMTVIEYEDDLIVIDAGLMFPDDSHPGVDLILPDYTYILENEDKLRGIIVTHGHEDHTGALPYLLKDLNKKVTIYSSKLTLGLIQGKLEEHRIKNQKVKEVQAGNHLSFGKITVDFFAQTHSIPANFGLFIRTPEGNILHSGDFKIDLTPVDGVTTDFESIMRFSKVGVDLMISDSTNAPRPGTTPSEKEVGKTLQAVISGAKQRVFVASFASHIHRLQQVCDAAVANGRKVAVTGRSMITNTKIARELGYLNIRDQDIIDAYDINSIPDDELLVLCTGSQGEPLSALARMANGEHKTLSIDSGDTVIISATPVPGNEKAVSQILNALAKIGADVWDKSRAMVHTSGHGSAEELKLLLSLVKPNYFMPIHGEAVHVRAHARLAESVGVDPNKIFISDNGDCLELKDGKVRWGDPVDSGIVYVDGLRIGDTDQVVLRDRRKLSEQGIITVIVTVKAATGKVLDVQFISRGVSNASTDRDSIDQAKERVEKTLAKAKHTHGNDDKAISRAVRESLSGYLWDKYHTRPMVIPVVMEV
ncbi:MAG: ribonuclease J [Coriobacteriia bacterium]|nr:ribonuclease J [Coriobacteriia bacterium]